MVNILTVKEFFEIRINLNEISDTWSDLWVILHLSKCTPARLLNLRYTDIENGRFIFRAADGLIQGYTDIGPGIDKIISSRRAKYPDDIYVFQSHSNRLQISPRPVTLIAFNAALKKASRGVTDKTVSSKSAAFLK